MKESNYEKTNCKTAIEMMRPIEDGCRVKRNNLKNKFNKKSY
jgi:hypothetical protein